jgi:hypothetical protein
MAGTAMKMNAVENFAQFQQMAGCSDLRDFAGTSEDIAICLLSAKARGAVRRSVAAIGIAQALLLAPTRCPNLLAIRNSIESKNG